MSLVFFTVEPSAAETVPRVVDRQSMDRRCLRVTTAVRGGERTRRRPVTALTPETLEGGRGTTGVGWRRSRRRIKDA